jgi:hypothetical protein
MVRAPAKYSGKLVEMRRMRCFFAEKNDYRCTVSTLDAAVIIVAPTIAPPQSRAVVEQLCGDVRNAAVLPACQRTIRFTPGGYGEDKVQGLAKRVVVTSPSIEVLFE